MRFERWREPFDQAGRWIVARFPGILSGKQGKKAEETLAVLRTTRDQLTLEEYYVRKFSRMSMMLFAGSLVLGVLALGFSGEVKWIEQMSIVRPGYGEGNLETEIAARVGEGETLDVPLIIGERKYSDDEVQEIFSEILKGLERNILGENTSLDSVKTDLSLPSSFRNGVIQAKWSVDPPDYMDDTGHFLLEVPKEGILASLTVTLTYEKEEVIQEFPVRFLPRDKTLREEAVDNLRSAVEEADERSLEKEEVILPEDLNGTPIRWGIRETSPFLTGILLLAAGLWYLYGRDDRELVKREKVRRQQMIMDYPVIVYKMSMLLGAGMTIRGAFFRVAFHYRDRENEELRYAYEEMLMACYQMEKGTAEAEAYETFGRRCQELRYLKFGSLLSQSLKKGSEGLAELLEQEAENGMEERKDQARKLGEEAGTKLLFPMILMLLLVMALLMIPAVLSF